MSEAADEIDTMDALVSALEGVGLQIGASAERTDYGWIMSLHLDKEEAAQLTAVLLAAPLVPDQETKDKTQR